MHPRLEIKDVILDQRPQELWTSEIINERKYRSRLFNSVISIEGGRENIALYMISLIIDIKNRIIFL